jgi:hypothetical protein
MEVLYPCGCGLHLHKKSITACMLCADAKRHISGQLCQAKGLEIVTLAICSPF